MYEFTLKEYLALGLDGVIEVATTLGYQEESDYVAQNPDCGPMSCYPEDMVVAILDPDPPDGKVYVVVACFWICYDDLADYCKEVNGRVRQDDDDFAKMIRQIALKEQLAASML